MSRVDKVAQALKEEISRILQRDIKDPRIGFVTITGVDIKPDLRFARVYFSVMGADKDIESAKAGLQSAVGFVRKLIGERIQLRYTPELVFEYDNSLVSSQHILDVLKEIERKKIEETKDVKRGSSRSNKKA